MGCVSLVDGPWLFDKNESVELNEYISIQDGIIVIIVLIFMIFSIIKVQTHLFRI